MALVPRDNLRQRNQESRAYEALIGQSIILLCTSTMVSAGRAAWSATKLRPQWEAWQPTGLSHSLALTFSFYGDKVTAFEPSRESSGLVWRTGDPRTQPSGC